MTPRSWLLFFLGYGLPGLAILTVLGLILGLLSGAAAIAICVVLAAVAVTARRLERRKVS